MPISKCKVCGKLIKRSEVIGKVYDKDYDFDACNDCNDSAENQD